jgi:molybdopterin/thiamine biosynthesis adenylyltransferase
MRYTVSFTEHDYRTLEHHLAAKPVVEQAAFLIARVSSTESEVRLLVQEVVPVLDEDVLEQSAVHMKIAARAYTRAMKRANDKKSCFLFVHSHPSDHPHHSQQDDREEAKLFPTAYIRIRTQGVHGSLIFTPSGISSGRVWLPDNTTAPLERVRIIGNRVRFWFPNAGTAEIPEFFDRQVRAFGRDIQRLFARLRIGVVGVGGTGSCVTEQLIRLGVGSLLIADGEQFEPSNVNRVYGSRVADATIEKVKIAERLAVDVGLGTKIKAIPRAISYESVLREFRECDVIFGCTDDEFGRSLLTRFAIYYLVPVLDMGVKIDSEDGFIRSIQGRVTTLLAGAACLNCRGRLRPDVIRAESIRAVNPEEAAELEEEDYIPELADPAPAVVPFTTAIAASAVTEFLHRLTGCLGAERESTEVLHLIDDTKLRTNRVEPNSGCFCGDPKFWGRGDTKPFLDTTWRPE